MPVVRVQPYGPVVEPRLDALVARLPAPLPADYLAFLRAQNGAEVVSVESVPGTKNADSRSPS